MRHFYLKFKNKNGTFLLKIHIKECKLKKLVEKIFFKIYNKEKFKECKIMTKIAESLEAVYIYIYIS